MAALANLSREERIGLLIAGTAHVALAVVLMLQDNNRTPIEPPKRITVSLAEEVALDTASPDPSPDPAAALAPVLAPVTEPEVLEQPEPKPTPRVRPTPTPTQRARPTPTPTPRASRRPTPTPTASRRPTPTPTATASRRPTPTPTATRRTGGTVESEFREFGTSTGQRSNDARLPASQIGQSERASLVQAISRQLRPEWDAPDGLQAELLVTTVTFRLNVDGSLDGQPRCNPTTGITDSNRTQAARHCELAIRAIRLAAPFDLPERYYEAWRLVTNFRFDGSL